MQTNSVETMTGIMASQGTNVVLAAIVALFLMGVLSVYVCSQWSRLKAEQKEREQRAEEHRLMFAKLLGGEGNGKGAIVELKEEVGGLKTSVQRIGQIVEELPCQAKQGPCPVVTPLAGMGGAVVEAG